MTVNNILVVWTYFTESDIYIYIQSDYFLGYVDVFDGVYYFI